MVKLCKLDISALNLGRLRTRGWSAENELCCSLGASFISILRQIKSYPVPHENWLAGASLRLSNPASMCVDPNPACEHLGNILPTVCAEDDAIFEFCLCPFNPRADDISYDNPSSFEVWPILPASAPGKFMLPFFFAAMRLWCDRSNLLTTAQVRHFLFWSIIKFCSIECIEHRKHTNLHVMLYHTSKSGLREGDRLDNCTLCAPSPSLSRSLIYSKASWIWHGTRP